LRILGRGGSIGAGVIAICPVSEARRRASDKYNAKCDAIQIRPLAPEGAAIRAAAAAAGESLQHYILSAVRDRMDKESAEG